ncbi:MAG: hypothetical protein AB8B55_08605, partial [Mariniblastus sp.]
MRTFLGCDFFDLGLLEPDGGADFFFTFFGANFWGSEVWGSEVWGSEVWGSEVWGSAESETG